MVQIFSWCFFANFNSSGSRAIVPSSFMISQMHADGTAAGEMHEIHGGLGVAGALEHAAGLGAQRKNVAGLHEIIRHGGRRGHDAEWFWRGRRR